jgi:hypothetical protein
VKPAFTKQDWTTPETYAWTIVVRTPPLPTKGASMNANLGAEGTAIGAIASMKANVLSLASAALWGLYFVPRVYLTIAMV